ncbi:DUF4214 domain-containing protein [Pseudoduganella namucuonensis]|uniref:Hemolysin-type calcium-binding repeat-containing protein n=1 Tax=Pseudoduganella namucuonensis TaxID=1035707 RepID=A0A1I7FQT6_9BURK|nr:DUF4214 domain-containing protein [Pseudoduganella namucuonensis]SFU38518.1 Hemolysin-type calcium-binding repeat-containing protein [Pseudoduganella namucuonensis]
MTAFKWVAGETKSIQYAAGDTLELSGIAASQLELSVADGRLLLAAGALGTLTLTPVAGGALTAASLALTFPDGGRYIPAGPDALTEGGDGGDYLLGDDQGNFVDAGLGDDRVEGGGDGDYLIGGAGDDLLLGGGGDDLLAGGDGRDTLDGGDGANLLLGQKGDDTYLVHSQDDYISDSGGVDGGVINADWYKTADEVENWTWAPGVQRLPYWVDALTADYAPYVAMLVRTAGRSVHYSFPTTPADFFTDDDRRDFLPFTEDQIAYTRKALAYIETVLNIKFEETDSPDQPLSIVFGNNRQEDSAAYANSLHDDFGSPLMLSEDFLVMHPSRDDGDSLYSLLMHELGHSLGLKHPFAAPDAYGGEIGAGPYLGSGEDQTDATVMSYTEGELAQYDRFSPLDIAALQYLYGVAPGATGARTHVLVATAANMIWVGAGLNIIDGAHLTADLTLNLEPGHWSHIGAKADTITAAGQITINFGSVIVGAKGGAGNDALTGNAISNELFGGAGNDTLSGGASDDYLFGGAGNDILSGGADPDYLVGDAGNDMLSGGADPDYLFGEAGNDTLSGGAEADQLFGGAGVDTAVFTGARRAYDLAWQNEALTVSALAGMDGTDTLNDVERLRFADGMLALDVGGDGAGGQVYRLYQAAFDRKPDAAGVGYWLAQADQGAGMAGIAESFLRSEEFARLYGGANPTDAAFVAKLYSNVLHRAYDQTGYDYWTWTLAAGASRAEVLLSFAAGEENYQQVAAIIANGYEYAHYG